MNNCSKNGCKIIENITKANFVQRLCFIKTLTHFHPTSRNLTNLPTYSDIVPPFLQYFDRIVCPHSLISLISHIHSFQWTFIYRVGWKILLAKFHQQCEIILKYETRSIWILPRANIDTAIMLLWILQFLVITYIKKKVF